MSTDNLSELLRTLADLVNEGEDPGVSDELRQAADALDAKDAEIERLRAEIDRFVLTNDECLSAGGKTAHRAWYRA